MLPTALPNLPTSHFQSNSSGIRNVSDTASRQLVWLQKTGHGHGSWALGCIQPEPCASLSLIFGEQGYTPQLKLITIHSESQTAIEQGE